MDRNILELILVQELNEDDDDVNLDVAGIENLVRGRGDNQVGVLTRTDNYFEATIPQYSLDQFKSHFRMTRATMEQLFVAVGHQLGPRIHKVPLLKKVMAAIWLLAKQEPFLEVGDRFDISPGTLHMTFFQVINALVAMRHTYIIWPNEHEQQEIASAFQLKSHGIPGVVGTIDGCHIPIKCPPNNSEDYYNRKQVHSMILQGVSDHNLRLRNIFVGMPGSVHDAQVFRVSPLYQDLTGDPPLLRRDMHLIGDAAYPLQSYLMTPFRNTGYLSQQQVRYNTRLSSIQSAIERCFGLLKGKLRRLEYVDMTNTDQIPALITAACVLHNFMLDHEGDEGMEEIGDGNEDEEVDDIDDDAKRGNAGHVKRDYIVSLL